ncbi:MAG: hypothetical protein CMJ94_11615 [Planctomycetes bacterium]|nr:hypothetical protein [Planctomycetota bacterium]
MIPGAILLLAAQIPGGSWVEESLVEASPGEDNLGGLLTVGPEIPGERGVVLGAWRDRFAGSLYQNAIGARSADTLRPIWSVRLFGPYDPAPSIAVITDFNLDGIDDVLVGQDELDQVVVLDGNSGLVLATFTGDQNSEFGSEVCAIEDVNWDGVSDWAVYARDEWGIGASVAGVLHLHSGIDGSRVRSLYSTSQSEDTGTQFSSIGDWNLDGVGDLVCLDRGRHTSMGEAIKVMSGLDGSTLHAWKVERATPYVVGDVTGDGLSDVVAGDGAANSSSGVDRAGRLAFLPSEAAIPGWTVEGQSAREALGSSVTVVPDLDFDGRPDIATSGDSAWVQGQREAGRVRILSSASGESLRRIQRDSAYARFGSGLVGFDFGGVARMVVGSRGWIPAGATGETGKIEVLRFDPMLVLSAESVSASAGGSIQLSANLGVESAGEYAFLLATRRGVTRSEFLGVFVPLAQGPLFRQGYRSGYAQVTPQAGGFLDASGSIDFQLTLPPNSGLLAGQVLSVIAFCSPLPFLPGDGKSSYAAQVHVIP